MSERKGTGNYDKERTQFNVEYVSLNEKNLYQEIKQTLKNRNIEFNDKPSTNMFNGITLGEHHLYKIKCIEYQEINPITAKPKASYKLIECNRIEEL